MCLYDKVVSRSSPSIILLELFPNIHTFENWCHVMIIIYNGTSHTILGQQLDNPIQLTPPLKGHKLWPRLKNAHVTILSVSSINGTPLFRDTFPGPVGVPRMEVPLYLINYAIN